MPLFTTIFNRSSGTTPGANTSGKATLSPSGAPKPPRMIPNLPQNNAYDAKYHAVEQTRESYALATKKLIAAGDAASVVAIAQVRPDLVDAKTVAKALDKSQTLPEQFCFDLLEIEKLPSALQDLTNGDGDVSIQWADAPVTSGNQTRFTVHGERYDGKVVRESNELDSAASPTTPQASFPG